MTAPLARRILVVDSDTTDFGRHTGHGAVECAAGVAERVLQRNPDIASRVDLIVAGAARVAASDGIASGLAQLVGARVGLATTPGVEVHAFCASSNAAVHEAALAIEAGRADVALVVGVEHLMASSSGPLVPDGAPLAGRHGFSPPVFYAMCADRYLRDTGAPPDALASVAVRNRRAAASNPHARFRDPITVGEVMESRMIAEPLTFLQCCPPADGAGALLLAAADVVSSPDDHVQLVGLGRGSADPARAELTTFEEDAAAARRAFAMAGIEPADVDVAEVHDAFTIAQLIHLEDVGLCARGEAWRHALDDDARPVVNPSGGLLSRGHPLGATGIAQFDSLRRYLTDDAVAPDARRYGFVQEAGGLRPLGQILSECAVLAGPSARHGVLVTGGEA